METKYKFLEFDEKAIRSYYAREGCGMSPSFTSIQGARHQHAKDKAIMLKLLEIIEMQHEAARLVHTYGYGVGVEKNLHKEYSKIIRKLVNKNKRNAKPRQR